MDYKAEVNKLGIESKTLKRLIERMREEGISEEEIYERLSLL